MDGERCSKRARFIFGRAAVLIVALAGLPAFGPAPVLAAQPTCGDVLTEDTKLSRSLVDCPGDGLVIGADNVRLDLDGHKIDGQGSGIGIANPDGHDGIRIEDGTVREFGTGIELTDTSGSKLRKLKVLANNGDGIALQGSAGNRIADNKSSGNQSDGITLYESDRNRITENSLRGNDAHGIVLETSSDLNRVEDNSVSDNHADGISIAVGSSRNEILENRVRRSGGSVGIFLVFDSNENRVYENLVEENGGGGILVLEADDNRIEENRAYANGQDGITVDDDSIGTLVKRNSASGNSDDGIDLQNAAGTLTKNLANGNVSLGIRAVTGVTDGGGNRAKGNGDPSQCTANIDCFGGKSIEVDPRHVEFGEQPYDSFTKRTVTITNDSSRPLTVTVQSPFVPDDFSPGQPESTCPWDVPTTLGPGESCTHVIGYYADSAEPFQGHREIELQVVARDGYGTIVKTRTVKVTARPVPG